MHVVCECHIKHKYVKNKQVEGNVTQKQFLLSNNMPTLILAFKKQRALHATNMQNTQKKTKQCNKKNKNIMILVELTWESTCFTTSAYWLALGLILMCHAKQSTLDWVTHIWEFTFGTVNLAIFIVKTASAYRLIALTTEETSHVKRVLQCIHHLLMAS